MYHLIIDVHLICVLHTELGVNNSLMTGYNGPLLETLVTIYVMNFTNIYRTHVCRERIMLMTNFPGIQKLVQLVNEPTHTSHRTDNERELTVKSNVARTFHLLNIWRHASLKLNWKNKTLTKQFSGSGKFRIIISYIYYNILYTNLRNNY